MLKKGNEWTYKTDDRKRYFSGYVGLRYCSVTFVFKYKVSPLDAIKAKVQDYGF